MKHHPCPVCGWPKLHEAPRSKSGGGSYEICPSCGFEFGVSDDDEGHTHASWRAACVERGMPWSSVAQAAPAQWDPEQQLRGTKP
jgi:rubredoxin